MPAAEYQRLLAQEKRLKYVAAAIDLGIWFCDLPFDELNWNDAVRDHFWVAPGARVTIDLFYERIHPEDRERVRAAIEGSIATRTLYDTQMRTWNPDAPQECKWVRAIGWTSFDADGQPTRFDGVTFNITEDKLQQQATAQAEAQLQRSETRLTLAMQAAKLGFWDWDIASDAVLLSDQLCIDWGIGTEGFTGQLMDVVARIHPGDRTEVENKIRGSLAHGGAYDLEYRVVRPGGQVVWVRAQGRTVRDAEGNNLRAVGTSMDVTGSRAQAEALREREQQFRTLADSMPVLVWITDAAMHVTYVNERWRQFFGGATGYNLSWHQLLHPDDLPLTLDRVNEGRVQNQSYAVEHRLLDTQGRYVWHLTRGVPFLDRDGVAQRWFGTCTDIQVQREAAASLEQAVALRDEFLSIASHELKTPLSSLILQTQMWRRRLQKSDVRATNPQHLLAIAEQNVQQLARLNRLVDDMLDVARIRSGRLSMQTTPMDLAAVVKDCVERMRPQFAADHLRYEGEANVYGAWDKVRLEQVVINLLSNALRYGRGQPVRVTLTTDATQARLSVRDQGVGIEPAAQERIFNRFERAVSRSEVSGLGLGLFITKEIIMAHGGTIGLESQVGVGSTFWVSLPLR